ncbi:LacI family DNA-binding transcriptional regulator [Paenibacillus sp. ClWae2A]|uniref:LacI family transcriptional regulator n=2 Tax=Paenibacillus TaxID=44249 RepID=A0ABS4RZU3_PAEXY|nr:MULTISPECIES: LacI family DNA-binding transcriptional regulator [Paenibacillus]APO47986.1 LacI family transcriptional regulator [Paenibacillus xylanexedens]MBP2248397.1 LacI family transcriptional regulator [Paenibacillus xylanexedens]MCP1423597.1 LacI family transcriptional regulator [Paenibacillus xylanexedens]MDT9720179.1 LacI family DNA-binding transcriptional regulator [Paenibacillus sp. ClWae2A]OMF03165.1 LacI family transcriptional regulator [Paenibacillus amylolyticus]
MNIKTIASLAGVSVATVSKIINNYPDISEETRQRVLKIMEETGYRPSSSAKTLATKKSSLVGVVFAGKLNVDFSHPFFVQVINAFKKQIGLLGYDLLFFSNEKFLDQGEDYLARSKYFQVDGCIIIAGDEVESSIFDLDASPIPCIGIDIELTGQSSCYIMSDNDKISTKVVEQFYMNGYRDVGFIGLERASLVMQQREMAFKRSLNQFSLDEKPEWVVYSKDYAAADGYEAAKKMLACKTLPRAVFAATDLLAFGAIRAFKEVGLRIPEDIAVAGCDDIEACRYTDPPLTTVKQDTDKIGRLAAMILFDLMNKQMDNRCIKVEPELVVRQSCGTAMLLAQEI